MPPQHPYIINADGAKVPFAICPAEECPKNCESE
jgi:hypothetical protein